MKKTIPRLFRQKCYKVFYEGWDGNMHALAAELDCAFSSVRKYRAEWIRMTDAEQEQAYKASVYRIENPKMHYTRTMYRQRGYIFLYEKRPGDLEIVLGCASSTANLIIREWNHMTDSQRKEAYRKAVKEVKLEYDKPEPEPEKEPEKPVSEFRTPYSFMKRGSKSNKWIISRY